MHPAIVSAAIDKIASTNEIVLIWFLSRRLMKDVLTYKGSTPRWVLKPTGNQRIGTVT